MTKSRQIKTGVIAGVVFMMCILFLATAEAGDRLGTAGAGNTHAADIQNKPNHWVNPNHGGSIGNCSKDGKFCWNIQIGNDQNHWGFPIEYYGGRARTLIADGQIEWANMTRYGVLYLGVWSRYDNRPFDCTVDVHRRRYHCQSH